MMAMSRWQDLAEKLNKIHAELQGKPDSEKCGYRYSVPSILNAYREADISFEDACKLLKMNEEVKA